MLNFFIGYIIFILLFPLIFKFALVLFFIFFNNFFFFCYVTYFLGNFYKGKHKCYQQENRKNTSSLIHLINNRKNVYQIIVNI